MREPIEHLKRVLDAIEATIEKRASQDQMSYTINGRRLDKTPLSDLLLLRKEYLAEYHQYMRQMEVKEGKRPGLLVRTKFYRSLD